MNFKSIKHRILLSTFTIVIITAIIIGYISYISNYNVEMEAMENSTNEKIYQIEKMIDDREANLEITKEALNKNLFIATKAIERTIRDIEPDDLNEELDKLAKDLNVSEIHISDENGILSWSNMPGFIGYDFNSDDQSRPFMKALEDKGFELAQDPTLRGIDNVLFQYIGVARKDEVGLVQIGIEPKELEKLIERIHISGIASTTGDEVMQVIILDSEGKIISHSDASLLDKNISEFDFGDQIINSEEGSFTYELDGEERLFSFDRYNDYKIISFTETKEYMDKVYGLLRTISIAILGIFILAGFFTYILANHITKPIIVLSQIIDRLAKYDMSFDENSEAIKYLDRKDEIGTITKALGTMQKNFISLIKSISDTSQQVASSSEELTATSQQSSTASEEVAKTIEEMARGASEQARNTEDGAVNINELGKLIEKDQKYVRDLNDSTKEVDTLKNEGIEILKDLINKTNQNNVAAKEVSEIIINTNESAGRIEKASQMIKNIAEQTNLLALNAAIEAARAGESGRGFSVVAEEIRKLAEQSNQFTEEIASIIKDLTDKTGFAVKKIGEVGKVVESQAKSVEMTNVKFEGIDSAIEKMKDVIKNINNSGQEMEGKKEEIIGIIENLSAISEENAAGTEEASASIEEQTSSMEEIANASEALAKLAEEMQERILKFKI